MNSDLVNTLLGDQEALKPGDGSLKRRISAFAASCCVIPAAPRVNGTVHVRLREAARGTGSRCSPLAAEQRAAPFRR